MLALVASSFVTGILYVIGWHPRRRRPGGDLFQVPPLMLWLADLPIWRKLIVVVVAMTVEEAFYRGFLQPRIGWIPSSLLFALSHAGYGMPTLLASVLAISLVIGWALRAPAACAVHRRARSVRRGPAPDRDARWRADRGRHGRTAGRGRR